MRNRLKNNPNFIDTPEKLANLSRNNEPKKPLTDGLTEYERALLLSALDDIRQGKSNDIEILELAGNIKQNANENFKARIQEMEEKIKNMESEIAGDNDFIKNHLNCDRS